MSRLNGSSVLGTSRNGTPKPRKQPTKKAKPQRRLALAVGGVGTFVLALSIYDCTSALTKLTGMPLALAALLAAGIDLGMVVSEMAAVVSEKNQEAHVWAERYIGLAVGLSLVLNAAAAASHAGGWLVVVAVPVGGGVPVFVYIAGRIAGALWTGR